MFDIMKAIGVPKYTPEQEAMHELTNYMLGGSGDMPDMSSLLPQQVAPQAQAPQQEIADPGADFLSMLQQQAQQFQSRLPDHMQGANPFDSMQRFGGHNFDSTRKRLEDMRRGYIGG